MVVNLLTLAIMSKDPLPVDTIVALATPPGIGAIAVIRVSGPTAISTVDDVFPGKDLSAQQSHTLPTRRTARIIPVNSRTTYNGNGCRILASILHHHV